MTTESRLTTATRKELAGVDSTPQLPTSTQVPVSTQAAVSTDIVTFLLTLLRNLWVIVLMAIIGVVAAFLVTQLQAPLYESSVSVIISPRMDSDLSSILDSINVLDQNVVGTYVQILRSVRVRNQVMSRLTSVYSLDSLEEAEVDVRPIENSTVMVVGVRSENLKLARDLANAIAKEVVQNNPIPSLVQAYPLEVLDLADVPEQPIAPQKLLNMLLGTAGGLALGIGLAFFLEDYRKARIKAAS